MQIPMVDLRGQYEALQNEIESGFQEVLQSTRFVLGPHGAALEEEIAAYCGVRHAVGVASGTDALHLALLASGIGPGDEVITTPFTFIATGEAIRYVGAKAVFVDIDPKTFNIDPNLIEAAITERTRAVLPVHLFGQPADLDPIAKLCKRYGLRLIEDCAQSFGAAYNGKMTGAWGDAGCFSFFPSKNLGCFGDGGMIVTDDEELAERLRMLRNHGSRITYRHEMIGFNSRLDELQAVVLRVKLKRIDSYNEARRRNAQRYNALLAGTTVKTPVEEGRGRHVYHQYTILTEKREEVQATLTAAGIASAIYYPIPLHLQQAMLGFCNEPSLPVTEATAKQVLSLPMFPELTANQIERVCLTLAEAL